MTHAAAATRSLHSPRRRPHGPAAWERAGAVSGVVAARLVATLALLPFVRGDHGNFSEEGS